MKNIYLTLLSVPSIGISRANELSKYFKKDIYDPVEFYEILEHARNNNQKLPQIGYKDIESAINNARRQIDEAVENEVSIISYDDENYPERLRSIKNYPLTLFCKGNIDTFNTEFSAALIGMRKPSEVGKRAAFDFGVKLAEMDITVISGLAIGCDTEGHKGCVSKKGQGVAVLAHGLDKIAGVSRTLADALLDNDGCLVSEYPLGTNPQKHFYVERDRIQSGMSDAVIVIETDVDGGTMHTVRFSENQSRKIFCLNPKESNSGKIIAPGNEVLINEGKATAIESAKDLEEALKNIERHSGELQPSFDF